MSDLQRVVVMAPAKVNLFLDITGLAGNGYHLLDTVMQAVSLSDVVVVGRSDRPGIRVTCSRSGVPEDASNLAYRAADLLLRESGEALDGGLHIHIDKRIPPQAGLGGGSADAAAVLIGLNRLLGLEFPPGRLLELGLSLGADVPFALAGGCARAQGVGERLSPLPELRDCVLVIAKPEAGVSTAEAYGRYDRAGTLRRGDGEALRAGLAAGSPAACGRALFNVFELACPSEKTEALKGAMLAAGALGAVLSGSGSAVVGLFAGEEAARRCARDLGDLAPEAFIARPVDHGAKIIHQS